MRKLIIVLIALVLVGVQMPAVLAQDATPEAQGMEVLMGQVQRGETCAWPLEWTVEGFNVGYPDAQVLAYAMPYMLEPGQSLVAEGTYPFARFFSLTAYHGFGVPGQGIDLLGWLRDSEIAPNAGSDNPAVDPNASTNPEQRQWTVRVTGTAPVGEGQSSAATPAIGENVIPAHPEGATNALGLFVVRMYALDDPETRPSLPALSLEDADGTRRSLSRCMLEERQAWTDAATQVLTETMAEAPRLPLPQSTDAPPQWAHTSIRGLVPNPDNRYLMVPFAWEPGRMLVFRAKSPAFPNTRAGDSPATPADLRYFSLCTGANIVEPPVVYPTSACVSDFEIPLDGDGFYTIVVSQPEDRPANATAENGVVWLRGSDPNLPALVVMRQMLPSEEFIDQTAWVAPLDDASAAVEIMGPYYPQTVYCDVSTFEQGGADACFAAGVSATPID